MVDFSIYNILFILLYLLDNKAQYVISNGNKDLKIKQDLKN